MRPTSLLTAQGNFFIAQSRSVAAVNRRQASGNKALAHQFQFFRRFPAFINPSLRLQLFDYLVIAFQTRRLAGFFRPVQTEPEQRLPQRIFIFPFGTFPVGVVDAEHKAAAELFGQKPVKQRSAGIADVHMAGRAGRKSDLDVVHCKKNPLRFCKTIADNISLRQ